jgi:hypothetical protein
VSLGHECPDAPWALVSRVEVGGTHRLDMDTSVNFYTEVDGLGFRWWMDLETRDANGSGEYKLDVPRIASVLAQLSEPGRRQFAGYLAQCAEKVRARGDEIMAMARRQYGDAATLQALARADGSVTS